MLYQKYLKVLRKDEKKNDKNGIVGVLCQKRIPLICVLWMTYKLNFSFFLKFGKLQLYSNSSHCVSTSPVL